MSKLTVSATIAKIKQSCIDNEYGDIRSMLDEYAATPLWSEQVALHSFLNRDVIGAHFEYNPAIGWTYTEEGA